MGKIVEKTKKKKKGRPSLLDLQKRSLKQEQEEQQQNHRQSSRNLSAHQIPPNYDSATEGHLRRSTRRNPNPSPEKDDDEDESFGKRRQKKLKLVLKLPSEQKSPVSCPNSPSSDGMPDSNSGTSTQKKRKINAIVGGSDVNSEKGEKSGSVTKLPANNITETQLNTGSSTPLPDKKLLLFILDRLQKKDTYGVFSEPVDPEELPDYFEVIEHPMDFGTIRKKLDAGAYVSLEQFELFCIPIDVSDASLATHLLVIDVSSVWAVCISSPVWLVAYGKYYVLALSKGVRTEKDDVFLISSNGMQYNAADTIYFRQARSIGELAQKDFENLRQDSDDNNPEPEPKVVRRGRPPTKSLKKPVGRPPLERTGSEFSSDATFATVSENPKWPKFDMRKGPIASKKSGLSEPSGNFYFPRNDVYTGWVSENKFDRADEGSSLKGAMKFGKRYVVIDENRRNTYGQFHSSVGTRELSVLSTFDGERRLLMPVGVYTEHGYARSLARFAANLGPVAWMIASKRIQMCVPSGTNFGPGWVGENDLPSKRTPLPSLQSDELSRLWPAPAPQNVHSTPAACSHERLTPSVSSSDINLSNNKDSSRGAVNPKPSSETHQGINGFRVSSQMMGKLVRNARRASVDSQSSQMLQTAHITTNNIVPVSRNSDPNNLIFSGNSTSTSRLAGSRGDPALCPPPEGRQPQNQNAEQNNLAEQNPDSVLPDLNVRFQQSQSRGSPRVDS